jgi:two-component system OmpR family response regulator
MKLLVVEDNTRLSERIFDKLHRQYSIDIVETGHEVLIKTRSVNYGVIILDLGLPDMSGLEVCKRLRASQVDTPILVLTGTDDMSVRVELLNQGADDFMTKPFDASELRARINTLGRRRERQPLQRTIEYADLLIDLDQRKVFRSGNLIDLRRKEFDILEYLVSNSGRVLTRDMIMNHVWDDNKSTWHSTIDVHIKHLRDKVDKPYGEPIIKTAYGLGYRVDSKA